MRAGDLVRFKYTGSYGEEWKIGLLKEYHTWEKVATILFEGKEIRVAASLTELHKRAKRY
jgi:hypothetical protein